MITIRTALAETVRALAVLALVFLSFAHQPALAAPGDGYAGTTVIHDFCGDPPHENSHAPCHACRADPGALPPAPTAAAPAFAALSAPRCPIQDVALVPARTDGLPNPRAPPATV